jgi:hypothetical protein
VAVIGAALVALVGLGLLLLSDTALPFDRDTRARLYVASACVAGALWLGAVALVRRGGLPQRTVWIVLAVAAAMRAMTFIAPPLLSSDVYRYVWDGRVQHAGINPYRYIPAAPQLEFLRDATIFPLVNRADYAPTIYPPAAEAIFALAGLAAPGLGGMKAIMAGFDALVIVALLWLLPLAGRDCAETLIYGWLPLPVWEFAGNGHVDAAASGLLALALLASARGRSALTGVALAAATLTKFLPGAVLPAFWRPGDWRLGLVFALTLVVFYLPYLSVGWHVFGFLGGYVSEEGVRNGHGLFPLELLGRVVDLPAWAPPVYAVLALLLLAVLALRFVLSGPLPAEPGPRLLLQARQAVVLGAVLLVALSPHYEWYFGWLAPLAGLAPLPAVLWLLAAAPLLALGPIEHLLIPVAVYVPAAALALWELRHLPASPLRAPPLSAPGSPAHRPSHTARSVR